MQLGLFFLWVLSAGAAFLAWFALEMAWVSSKGRESRRRMTGCELARQVLDRNRLNYISLHAAPSGGRIHLGLEADQLALHEKIFYGSELSHLAAALHEAGHFLSGNRLPLPAGLRRFQRNTVRVGVLLSWIGVAIGFLFPSQAGWAAWGELIFILITLRALSRLGEEWEATDRSLSQLLSLEGFGTDERVGIKRVLDRLRWSPLAEIMSAPFSFFPQRPKGVPAHVS